jgi:hypothetical protein
VRSGLEGFEHGAALDQVGMAPRHYPCRGVLVAATSAFENLVSHPAMDLTAGRKFNARPVAASGNFHSGKHFLLRARGEEQCLERAEA